MEDELKEKLISWVNEVFKKKKYDSLSTEFENSDGKKGFIGDIILAGITGEKNGDQEKFDVIIKKSKDKNTETKALVSLSLLYTFEVYFYGKIVPFLNQFAKDRKAKPIENIPHCYGTINKNDEYVILMDNLNKKGFKMLELVIPHDMNHTKLVLEGYAKFHAFSLAIRDQKSDGILQDFKAYKEFREEMIADKLVDVVRSSVRDEIDFVINLYKEKQKFDYIENLEKLRDNFIDIYKDTVTAKDEQYLVLRHSDCWNNNFLFHYKEDGKTPNEVAIIDWQNGVIGSPLADIAHYLFFCCSSSELEHIDELLQIYYNTLCKKLFELGSSPQKCFPREDFEKSFKRYASFGIGRMPMIVKMTYKLKTQNPYDISETLEDKNYQEIMDTELKDLKEYFIEIDKILKICIEHGYI